MLCSHFGPAAGLFAHIENVRWRRCLDIACQLSHPCLKFVVTYTFLILVASQHTLDIFPEETG